jgi:arginyl-tRNA synthetase
MDTKSGYGLPISVEKDVLLLATLPNNLIKLIDSFCPQRTATYLITFADKLNRVTIPVDIRDSEV